jgi:hypothetical protein
VRAFIQVTAGSSAGAACGESNLDQAADGFGANGLVVLFRCSCVEAGHEFVR